eukprot:2691543-Amphidinium_carterae.1
MQRFTDSGKHNRVQKCIASANSEVRQLQQTNAIFANMQILPCHQNRFSTQQKALTKNIKGCYP